MSVIYYDFYLKVYRGMSCKQARQQQQQHSLGRSADSDAHKHTDKHTLRVTWLSASASVHGFYDVLCVALSRLQQAYALRTSPLTRYFRTRDRGKVAYLFTITWHATWKCVHEHNKTLISRISTWQVSPSYEVWGEKPAMFSVRSWYTPQSCTGLHTPPVCQSLPLTGQCKAHRCGRHGQTRPQFM